MKTIFLLALLSIASAHWPYPCKNDPLVEHHRVNQLEEFDVSQVTIPEKDDDIEFSASPSLLKTSGDWITATFSGIDSQYKDLIIAVYSPSTVNLTLTSPVKYKHLDKIVKDGKGSTKFKLVNMHTDYILVLFSNGTGSPVVLAKSNTIDFVNYQEPLQGHIALGDKRDEIRAMWNAGSAEVQYLQWGYSSGQYTVTTQSNASTYTADDLCGSPANSWGWKEPGLLQTAKMHKIQFNSVIYYRFGSNETGWSSEFSFSTPKDVGPSVGVKIIAYGDMGKITGDGSDEHWNVEQASINTTDVVFTQIKKNDYDLVLHIGDIAYAVGWSAQWDEFMDQIQPVATAVPYMTCPGNHERDFPKSGSWFTGCDSGGECGIPYEGRFMMPDSNRIKQWYSFDWGNVHIVMMSTEHNFSLGSAQNDWIRDDLSKVNRSITPWVVFGGHRPMYIDTTPDKSPDGEPVAAKELREGLEEMFLKYGVNLAIWGHRHSYQRSCPVYKEECGKEGTRPVHVIIGMSGFRLDDEMEKNPPSWLEYANNKDHGYSTIETTEDTLSFKFMTNAGAVADSFEIKKQQ